MSFAFRGGDSAAGGDGGRKWFHCHQCDRAVIVVVSPSAELLCPRCNGSFVEEYENPSPPGLSRVPPAVSDDFSSILPLLFPTSSATHTTAAAAPTATVDLQNPSLFSNPSSSPAGRSESPFDPFAFLMNHLQGLQSSGAQIQFVIGSSPSEGRGGGGGGVRLPANIGDYFIGPGLEQLIQQLAENDPNRHGTPPASKSAVENLPTIKVTEELQNSEMNQCAVCQDDFEKDMEVKQMPCRHIYHAYCLLPWLELHNSCPVCRHELPTDDPDYENRRGAAQGNGQGGSGGTSSGRGENRTVRRSFSIMLPYPFRGDDGSNSGSGVE